MTNDARADRGRAITAAGAHGGNAVGEFDFTDGTKRLGPVRAIHRAAIDIDGGDYVVAGFDVFHDVVEKIALSAAIPEVMMRIHNGSSRIDNVFVMEREPVLARVPVEPAPVRGDMRFGHPIAPAFSCWAIF